MAVLKLHLDEFDEIDYDLIAIHSVIEDYRLAYFINQKLPIILSKSKEEIGVTVKEGEAFFMKFIFNDSKNDINWSLISNKNEIVIKKKSIGQNLFLNTAVEIATKVYLLPELKKVDYFLKIENNKNTFDINQIIKTINTIDRIAAVYAVIPEKIKSKNNLIF
ncbi:IPExxxVDY family protein [Flavobacterium psychrotolerans]|uniref:IPExxxVDY family protein n=1 Tax=Flavobacterium psychrotolerans TaxID=2169410 RepID=A0A2U1JH64_9FLAO|nr:IPExxxVDY family protein [Flavobacterium psychrotolerans]PWA04278.1 IPExxxVDY family protein [Flavobacterium psychrotolerans]